MRSLAHVGAPPLSQVGSQYVWSPPMETQVSVAYRWTKNDVLADWADVSALQPSSLAVHVTYLGQRCRSHQPLARDAFDLLRLWLSVRGQKLFTWYMDQCLGIAGRNGGMSLRYHRSYVQLACNLSFTCLKKHCKGPRCGKHGHPSLKQSRPRDFSNSFFIIS